MAYNYQCSLIQQKRLIFLEEKELTDKENHSDSCTADSTISCCKIEALINVDERGQMVLPKETRERAGIQPGEKLALVSGQRNGKVCCLFLIKVDEFTGMVKDVLGPLLQEIVK